MIYNADNDNAEFRFYVYCWRYPDGRPFYIGKGNGRRDSQPKNNKLFKNITDKIRKAGGEPQVVRLHDGLMEADALRIEASYIKLFGRRDLKTGVLANMTNGGEGVVGLVFSEASRSRLSASIKEYCRDPVIREMKALANRRRYENPLEREKSAQSSRSRGPASRNKTGFKGVASLAEGVWRATINVDNKQRHLGSYESPASAARAYDCAARYFWGEGNCYLNFPDDDDAPDVKEKVFSALDPEMGRREKLVVAISKKPAMTKSGFKGVAAKGSKWHARIRVNGKLRHIGSFESPVEAAKAYDAAALEAWGSGCHQNIIGVS